MIACQQARGELVEGRPEPFKVLWSHADDDIAYTVDLEHMTRHVGDRLQPRTRRCTQVYRRENGQWKVVLRHADELPRKDQRQR